MQLFRVESLPAGAAYRVLGMIVIGGSADALAPAARNAAATAVDARKGRVHPAYG